MNIRLPYQSFADMNVKGGNKPSNPRSSPFVFIVSTPQVYIALSVPVRGLGRLALARALNVGSEVRGVHAVLAFLEEAVAIHQVEASHAVFSARFTTKTHGMKRLPQKLTHTHTGGEWSTYLFSTSMMSSMSFSIPHLS